ncbi:hypothetical protein EDEG_00009 [Edhazardia aedis USNM 41457]|uniref:Uncharacterized protein n=1 Tax=Edhazardia aedis (strain USNM 41457) TaxID=1003232 RepID=J9D6J9_EDHAE|nr:hypothetical protein EDEG_00009 [Edhazardia aedis USNM 41457]|eukprot:EJW03139.1 hypothetical protein EDEG_00009 [Edhazardia aedis USNM 41457]
MALRMIRKNSLLKMKTAFLIFLCINCKNKSISVVLQNNIPRSTLKHGKVGALEASFPVPICAPPQQTYINQGQPINAGQGGGKILLVQSQPNPQKSNNAIFQSGTTIQCTPTDNANQNRPGIPAGSGSDNIKQPVAYITTSQPPPQPIPAQPQPQPQPQYVPPQPQPQPQPQSQQQQQNAQPPQPIAVSQQTAEICRPESQNIFKDLPTTDLKKHSLQNRNPTSEFAEIERENPQFAGELCKILQDKKLMGMNKLFDFSVAAVTCNLPARVVVGHLGVLFRIHETLKGMLTQSLSNTQTLAHRMKSYAKEAATSISELGDYAKKISSKIKISRDPERQAQYTGELSRIQGEIARNAQNLKAYLHYVCDLECGLVDLLYPAALDAECRQ